ncbi:MAG: purine-nucleoside phosphorylase [Clostridia bacterium]|nr:purine-nucleoside phosphorylase [Clostridia bacterium]
MNREVYEKVMLCVAAIRAKTDFVPRAALILGSGLGDFADSLKAEAVVEYSEIEGFPVSTVAGHRGRFIFAMIDGVPTVAMQGRVHYYEGYSMQDVVLPIRVMRMLGAEKLLITNASGGINPAFDAGDFMLITGQISLFVPSPLIGPNVDEFGLRFPDMSNIYSKELSDLVRDAARKNGIDLKEGTYAQLTGPQFESPQEIRALGILGADAVGMSTAVEAIAANHMGMKICGISCVSNKAAGLSKQPLTHEEVQETAARKSRQFTALVHDTLAAM